MLYFCYELTCQCNKKYALVPALFNCWLYRRDTTRKRSKQNLLLCAANGLAVNTLIWVSECLVSAGQSNSQFTSNSASTTLSEAAIGLHKEETVTHAFPQCPVSAESKFRNNSIIYINIRLLKL